MTYSRANCDGHDAASETFPRLVSRHLNLGHKGDDSDRKCQETQYGETFYLDVTTDTAVDARWDCAQEEEAEDCSKCKFEVTNATLGSCLKHGEDSTVSLQRVVYAVPSNYFDDYHAAYGVAIVATAVMFIACPIWIRIAIRALPVCQDKAIDGLLMAGVLGQAAVGFVMRLPKSFGMRFLHWNWWNGGEDRKAICSDVVQSLLLAAGASLDLAFAADLNSDASEPFSTMHKVR